MTPHNRASRDQSLNYRMTTTARSPRTVVVVLCLVVFAAAVVVRPNATRRGTALAQQEKADKDKSSGQQKGQPNKPPDNSQQTTTATAADDEDDPDLPAFANGKVNKEDYLKGRDEQLTLMRGLNEIVQKGGNLRVAAIEQMQQQARLNQPALGPAWVQIGPAPIPNGQTQTVVTAVSGRITAVAIDPTNSSNIYVGAAQGGVYRSLDGGTTWLAIFDSAQSLSIGALALVPGDPTTLYVGTGEANGSADSFAGVGLYRINNVTTSPVLTGPINPIRNYNDAGSNPQSVPVFNGRSISKILVRPSQPGTLLVGVAGGVIGIGADAPFGGTLPPVAMRGLYRLTNADGPAAGVVGERITVTTAPAAGTCFDSPCTGNRNVNDMVFDPADATGNSVVLWMNGLNAAGDGGIYRSTNAWASPATSVAFTQTFITTATSTSNARGALVSFKQGVNPTVVYAASGEPSVAPDATLCNSAANPGAIRRSTDGGLTWSAKLPGGGGFCGGQCFYNIGLAVVPGATTATDTVYIAGNVRSTNCAKLMGKSVDGGATVFANMDVGLHADTHVVAVDPSNPNIVYHGNDGGIYKSTDAAVTWTSLNNTGFHATQFESIAVHPTDRYFTIGGTQDNGTEKMTTGFTWTKTEGGDGGYAMIDQNAVDTTTVTMYHTFFNQAGTQIGLSRSLNAGTNWSFIGCSGVATTNGITCTNPVNFYAPTALGPGTPNTVYLGTDRLYRSSTSGTANLIVSQAPLSGTVPLSSIGISPQDDNVRMVGQNNGAIWFTTTGSSTLTSLDPVGVGSVIPDKYVTRCVIDPNDQKTAYVALAGYMGGTTAVLSHVWRITNLNTTPVLTAINTGLPDVPVNAFVVDPANSAQLFAGTDIAVYRSTDTGASWSQFGSGLPIVSVFDMAIAQRNTASEFLRIATHGRGMWEADLGPTLAKVIDAEATAYDNGQVLLSWQTGNETDNLGFNVYREENGERVPVTRQIIAGSSLMTGPGDSLRAEHAYKWTDFPPSGLKRVRYWIEDVDLTGQSKWTGPINVKLAAGKRRAANEQNAMLLASLGLHKSQATTDAGSYPAQMYAQPARITPAMLQLQSSLAAQSAVKIGVKQEGWYRVSQPDLLAAGLNPNIDPRNLQLFVDGNQVPCVVKGEQDGRFDSGDAIEFYGVGVSSAVTDKRIYWLVAGSQPGQRVKVASTKGNPASVASFAYTVERKDRTIYFSSLRNGETENFFGPVIARTPVSQVLAVQHPGLGAATIEVAVQGVTRLPHKVRVSLNKSDIGEVIFSGQTLGVGRFSMAQSKLQSGDNTIDLVAQGGDSDVCLLDSIRITYQHNFVADNDALSLTAQGGQQVGVDGFSSGAVRAIDVTDPAAPQELASTVKPSKSGYAISFAVSGAGQRRLLAFGDNQIKRAASVAQDLPSNLRQNTAGVDLIILTRRDFMASVDPLRALRQKQGLSVAVVDVEDVYDEFSFGQKTPQAIKDFILYARNNWRTTPRFALFVGDASLDPKNYLGFGDFDFVSTKLIDTQFMETASDDWFADSNEDGVPEIAVGRLPARTPAEAARIVGKIASYDSSQASNGVLLVSDANDSYNFESASAQLRTLIPDGVNVREINRGQLGDEVARAQLVESINQGRGLVNYTGHGNVTVWRANLLTPADARGLTNGDKLPLFVTMTCLNGYFQDPAQESLAESLMEAERGGAVAVWASSGMTEPNGQAALDQQVFKSIFETSNGGSLRLGEAVLRAKAFVGDRDIRRTWILFGDPSMRVR